MDGHRDLGRSFVNYRQNATLNLAAYVQLMREPRMTEGSFFIYIRMETSDIINRVDPES